jgi:hypothetical protein
MGTFITCGIAIVLSCLGFLDFLDNISPIYFFAAAILFYLHGILSKLSEKKEKNKDLSYELPYESDSSVDLFSDNACAKVDVSKSKKPQSKKGALEAKLKDLMDALKIGLVPKKDLKEHKEKIKRIRMRLSKNGKKNEKRSHKKAF